MPLFVVLPTWDEPFRATLHRVAEDLARRGRLSSSELLSEVRSSYPGASVNVLPGGLSHLDVWYVDRDGAGRPE